MNSDGKATRHMRDDRRRANLALGLALVVTAVTGVVANLIGTDEWVDAVDVHGAAALVLVVLVPWKAVVVRDGLRRRGTSRPGVGKAVSVLFGLLVLVALGSGLAHATGLVDHLPGVLALPGLTVMQVHVGAAVLSLALLVAHWRRHPVRPRRVDVGRRALLSAAGVSAVAAVALVGWESALAASSLPGGRRRFTGSVPTPDLTPAALPVYAWIDDSDPGVDEGAWRLRLPSREVDLAALRRLSTEQVEAVLDCTGGWASRQRWQGVRLDRLLGPLPEGTASVVVRSRTGYVRQLPLSDLERAWLVTSLGGRPLSGGHGFPARLVVPHRRGFWWVKWVDEIEPSTVPWWLQAPFPTT
jgi:DMSO/TMAO reductase YedYZ molybdopterin-dependent catalytic subunit